ncbi:MAG: glycosyl transferase [Clostridiales bacterium]|nr:MAG: glycosyl transferase [Clostridiales bacterium]
MKNKIRMFICFILLCIIALAFVFIPSLKDGRILYQKSIKSVSIKSMVEKIESKKNYIKFDEIPKYYIDSLIYSEDRRFYSHKGYDIRGILRAVYYNLKHRKFVQGGSTITQQLAKNMYFSFDKNLSRKFAELFVAMDLEKELSKEKIIELHTNIVYFGEDCYGIYEASRHYFNVEPSELNKNQIDKLIRTIKSPTFFNPNASKKLLDVGFKKVCLGEL